MGIGSALSIYLLVWVVTLFAVLPFGVRTPDEVGAAKVKGQADSAPVEFRAGRLLLRAAILALVVTALYVANYINGWITVEDLILWGPSTGAE